MRFLIAAMAVLSLAFPIRVSAGTAVYFGTSVTLTSANVITAGWATQFLNVVNQSANVISCAFGQAAVLSGAGSIDIQARSQIMWDAGTVPAGAMNCISNVADSPATVGYK